MVITEFLKNLPPVFSVDDAFDVLSLSYKAPLKALAALEKRGVLLRLRRNQYAFSQSFDPMVAANLIHSPSYLSFETALSFYGLIPERTEVILSVVDGRPQAIQTSVAHFEYFSQSTELFAIGMDLQISQGQSLAIANPEKALLDTLAKANLKTATTTSQQILDYVVNGLRVDRDELSKLSPRKMKAIAPLYRNLAPQKLVAALAQKEDAHE